MPILQDASSDLRRGLLDLYSVATLREAFQRPSLKKDAIVDQEGDSDDQTQIDRVTQFIGDYLGCCKQHVYVFAGQTALPASIGSGELVASTATSALFVTVVDFEVFTFNPPAQNTATYLWPVKVEMIGTDLVVRFVTLERSMSALFGESTRVIGRSLSEDSILEDWGLTTGLRADLNKGVKALWDDDWFDCTKGRYKKPFAVSQESMDAGRGIKAEYPDIYNAMVQSPIQNSVFKLSHPDFLGLTFSVDPTDGRMGFQTYTRQGVSNEVIQKIIESNQ